MGLYMLFRRRWRMLMWLTLLVVVVLNAAIFLGMPGSKIGGSSRLERTGGTSHLQAVRKRLNKSSSNSSSLNYVDWDAKDGAFDPEISKHRLIHKLADKERRDDNDNVNNDHENPDDEDDNENDGFYDKTNLRNPDDEQDDRERSDLDKYQQPSLTDGRRQGQVLGGRANYSLAEVDELVNKFQAHYSSTPYVVDNMTVYEELLKQLHKMRRKGAKLMAYINNRGRKSWERFHSGIHQHYLYDPEDVYIGKLLTDLNSKKITNVEQKEGGTQLKLILTFEDDGQALFKPMRYPREQETLPDHFYFADYERHNAEIASFHLDKSLGFHRVPPTEGRLMNISRDIHRLSDSKLAKTFFVSPAGNWCFHGSCSYYCDSSHPICGHPMMVEGSLAAFLPPNQMAKRKTWRNPWKRSYSKHRKAYWEVYDDLCEKVKRKHPYNEGRRLLDVLDMSVFDFLTGNLDRHHYETFRDFGNDTFLLHLDNGRAFGKSKYDCISCLAPVRQCCMIRLSTMAKLVKLYNGPDSLSSVMRASMKADPLNPILVEPHLDALDRRVSKILHVISGCIKDGASWDDVIVDDGVT